MQERRSSSSFIVQFYSIRQINEEFDRKKFLSETLRLSEALDIQHDTKEIAQPEGVKGWTR